MGADSALIDRQESGEDLQTQTPIKISNVMHPREATSLARELESVKDPLAIEEIEWVHDDAPVLPDTICRFTNVKKIEFRACAYTSLPSAFGNLEKLEELKIKYCKLTALPQTFGNLRRLRVLYLQSSKVTALPWSFCRLKALETLFLTFSGLEALPEDFGGLESLDFACLAGNKLKSLPESFGNLVKLTGCTLSLNPDLISLPASFSNLAKLRWLEVRGIPGLKFDDALARLPGLQYIYLDEQQAATFPEGLKSALNSRGCKVFYEMRIEDDLDDTYRLENREL